MSKFERKMSQFQDVGVDFLFLRVLGFCPGPCARFLSWRQRMIVSFDETNDVSDVSRIRVTRGFYMGTLEVSRFGLSLAGLFVKDGEIQWNAARN